MSSLPVYAASPLAAFPGLTMLKPYQPPPGSSAHPRGSTYAVPYPWGSLPYVLCLASCCSSFKFELKCQRTIPHSPATPHTQYPPNLSAYLLLFLVALITFCSSNLCNFLFNICSPDYSVCFVHALGHFRILAHYGD